jgi:transcriptional regulator with XRE-family HTH domain
VATKANKAEPVEPDQLIVTPEIGARLRAARTARGLGVRALSRIVGVSGSTISQIELGNVMPSVATLYRLVSVLQISMDELFAVAPPPDGAEPADEPGVVGARPADGARTRPSRAEGPVRRAEERPSIKLASGVRWELLSNAADAGVEFIWSRYDADGESCPADGLIRHGGKEFGYIFSGRLGVTIGFDTYELDPGDSISFDSTQPHRLFALDDEPVEVLWVVIDRNGDERGPAAPAAG